MGGVSWTAAVTQAQVRLDATERVVASAQLEASLADDGAQSVHAELDRHRRSTTVKEFSLKLARCRVLPMRAPLVNWKTPCSIELAVDLPARATIAFRMHSRNERVPRKSRTVAKN